MTKDQGRAGKDGLVAAISLRDEIGAVVIWSAGARRGDDLLTVSLRTVQQGSRENGER